MKAEIMIGYAVPEYRVVLLKFKCINSLGKMCDL